MRELDEVFLQMHIRRFEPVSTGFEQFWRQRLAAVGQCASCVFPRRRLTGVQHRSGQYFDREAGVDQQLIVGTLERQPGQRIAEYIQLIATRGRLRTDLQLPVGAALPGARPRPQMRQLLGQGHRAVVVIMGVVENLVTGAHQTDTVRWLTSSTWAKCRSARRSETCPLASAISCNSAASPSMAARTLASPNSGFSRQPRSNRARRSTNCGSTVSRGTPKSSLRRLRVRVTSFNWNNTA
ncbi:hypothetical protein D3C71_1486630 [compost metagenome]